MISVYNCVSESASHPSMLRMDAASCQKLTFRWFYEIQILAREMATAASNVLKVADSISVPDSFLIHVLCCLWRSKCHLSVRILNSSWNRLNAIAGLISLHSASNLMDIKVSKIWFWLFSEITILETFFCAIWHAKSCDLLISCNIVWRVLRGCCKWCEALSSS